MFTGIIRAVAKIKKSEVKKGALLLTVEKPRGWKLKIGDSIATDGVCLTVRKILGRTYVTELMPETLEKTTFGRVIPEAVNLEQPLKLEERLEGHLVLGHVDAVGEILAIRKRGRSKVYTIAFPEKFAPFVIPKGSIALDGISLTVVDVSKRQCTVNIMDFTLQYTTFGRKKVGDGVNIEFDMVAKYLRKMIQ